MADVVGSVSGPIFRLRSVRVAAIAGGALLLAGCAGNADKAQHFAVGAVTAAAVTHMTGSPWKGCAASLALGVAKEVYDSTGRGDPDGFDALATGAGCSVGFAF